MVFIEIEIKTNYLYNFVTDKRNTVKGEEISITRKLLEVAINFFGHRSSK